MDEATRKKKFGRTREEHAAYMREWRKKNPDSVKGAARRHYQKNRKAILLKQNIEAAERRESDGYRVVHALGFSKERFLSALKETAGCCDCGRSKGVRLDFDHRQPPQFKIANYDGRTWSELSEELMKCEVRCVSCHAKRHRPSESMLTARERDRIYKRVRRAVERGAILKPDQCQNCATRTRLHAHHEDYTKPLEVEWLCRPCHLRRHEWTVTA